MNPSRGLTLFTHQFYSLIVEFFSNTCPDLLQAILSFISFDFNCYQCVGCFVPAVSSTFLMSSNRRLSLMHSPNGALYCMETGWSVSSLAAWLVLTSALARENILFFRDSTTPRFVTKADGSKVRVASKGGKELGAVAPARKTATSKSSKAK